MSERIEELQREIESEKRRIANCSHEWGKPFRNDTTKKVGYGSVQDGCGSDPHWSYAGYRDEPVKRFTRICSICGKEEHTEKETPVISSYEPSFN